MNLHRTAVWEAIDRILWEEWDPIGVNADDAAKGEYSEYVGLVIRILQSGADAKDVAAFLSKLQIERMGLHPGGTHNTAVATQILKAWHASHAGNLGE